MTTGLADAYSATGGAWQAGPGPVYDRLAEVVVAHLPHPVAGRRVLDVGAGTGAAGRAAAAAGAAGVVAVDVAVGMLRFDAGRRPPATAGDALALPFRDSAFDAAVAAFSLNHVDDPVAGLREMARVTRVGGGVVASAYGRDDTHPVKAAVEAALSRRGWTPDPWQEELRTNVTPRLATPPAGEEVAAAAGLRATVATVRVPFPDFGPDDLVAWRLGMAQHAPFVAALSAAERQSVVSEAIETLGASPPTLIRSIVVISATVR